MSSKEQTPCLNDEVQRMHTREVCELQCKLLKKCYEANRQNRILNDLKKKQTELQKIEEEENNDLSLLINYTKQLSDLRKSIEIENEIDSILNKTGENSVQYIMNLIDCINTERQKVVIQNAIIKTKEQLSELINSTQSLLITFQTKELQNMKEIVELAEDLPFLDGNIDKSLGAIERCSDLICLLKRLTLHAQSLES